MGKQALFILSFLFALGFFQCHHALAAATDDGSEQWGYVEVRPKAHLFWWLYRSPYRVENPSHPWPTVLWLEGGPGGSGAGIGNFFAIGPLDVNLDPRNYTWLKKADLLFVDSPVGTGFSYVEDEKLLVRTDEEAATDLTTLLKKLFNANKTLQKSPLYIFGESYGGKFALTLGLSAIKAIEAGQLKLQLGGIALGDSWISPEDFVVSWGPLLKDLSRMDENGLKSLQSNNVDLYNFLLDSPNDNLYPAEDLITSWMNGPIRKMLKIIPKNVTWQALSNDVFEALVEGDFIKPRMREVDELLAKGINVSIYNGQLDIICSIKGVESRVNKLQWQDLKKFQSLNRTALYCGQNDTSVKGFTKSYKNFYFYWILGAGHFVPVYQPCVSLQMVDNITQSPN